MATVMATVKRRYPTCQTCGRYFKTKAGATAHLVAHPGHKIR